MGNFTTQHRVFGRCSTCGGDAARWEDGQGWWHLDDRIAHNHPVALHEKTEPESGSCPCPPCPGRGDDGHGMTHCAECCFGTRVEADPTCPIHGMTPSHPRRACPMGDVIDLHHTRCGLNGIAEQPLPTSPVCLRCWPWWRA